MNVSVTFKNNLQRLPLARLVSVDHAWGLADQAVVSGTNFLTLMLIVRWTSTEEVGLYSLAVSILTILMTIQDSLVSRPYSIQFFKTAFTRQEHAMGTLAMSLMLSAAAMAIAAAAAGFLLLNGDMQAGHLLVGFALAIPALLLREFARRFAFANLLLFEAFLLDTLAAVLVFCGLAYLEHTDELSSATALLCIGAAHATVAITWLAIRRTSFRLRREAVGQTIRQSWGLGRWLLPSQIALQAQGYIAHWVSLMIGGVAVTGIYAASLSIVALINPFLVGMFNIMTPKAVRALQADGIDGLRRLTARYTLLTALTVIPFAGFMAVSGDRVMAMIYPNPDYAGNGHILTLLAISAAIASLGGPATIALSVAEMGKAVAGVAFATFVGGILFITPMMMAFGIAGAAIGVLTTELFGSALKWLLVMRLLANDYSSEMLPGVATAGAITGNES